MGPLNREGLIGCECAMLRRRTSQMEDLQSTRTADVHLLSRIHSSCSSAHAQAARSDLRLLATSWITVSCVLSAVGTCRAAAEDWSGLREVTQQTEGFRAEHGSTTWTTG
ncbi:hypothetical protein INR49_009672 [Caranx melampygus]|nr:hypothetical protein INR49_009672 [Caranx melampygus]